MYLSNECISKEQLTNELHGQIESLHRELVRLKKIKKEGIYKLPCTESYVEKRIISIPAQVLDKKERIKQLK
jgi:hypothetical protein